MTEASRRGEGSISDVSIDNLAVCFALDTFHVSLAAAAIVI